MKIFTEHFWRHVWGPWSDVKHGTTCDDISWRRVEKYQERVCTYPGCNAVDRVAIEDGES